ncbi:MAG: hypothetical protein MZU84_09415 [Sphingobacterium sp.]|nr:hypothetical protein [Sphingobacterium sp.]
MNSPGTSAEGRIPRHLNSGFTGEAVEVPEHPGARRPGAEGLLELGETDGPEERRGGAAPGCPGGGRERELHPLVALERLPDRAGQGDAFERGALREPRDVVRKNDVGGRDPLGPDLAGVVGDVGQPDAVGQIRDQCGQDAGREGTLGQQALDVPGLARGERGLVRACGGWAGFAGGHGEAQAEGQERDNAGPASHVHLFHFFIFSRANPLDCR